MPIVLWRASLLPMELICISVQSGLPLQPGWPEEGRVTA